MTSIPAETLGDGLTVGAIGYGTMGLAGVYGPADHNESLATLHHAVDSGVTLIDTADVYGGGSAESLVAELLADRRDEVTVATKFGIVNTGGGLSAMSARNDAAYVREACEASLARLGVEAIDLFYLHRRQVSVPLADTIGAMAQLVSEGKVRHLGLSEVTAEELRAAHGIHPIAAVQSEWSLWSRDVERSVVPAAAELGVGFVPYSPLGRGFLTGTLTDPAAFTGDARAERARFTGVAFERNRTLVRVVQGIAAELDATPAQVALAWLRLRAAELGVPAVPIPGTRRAERIDENLGSLELMFTPVQWSALGIIAEKVIGQRSDSADPDWTSESRERASAH